MDRGRKEKELHAKKFSEVTANNRQGNNSEHVVIDKGVGPRNSNLFLLDSGASDHMV